jgi:hypothetical protein
MLGINLNRSSVANYNHFTQTIHLNRAEEPDLINLTNAVLQPDWDAGLLLVDGARTVLAPLAHETRHWLDMNCSVRGLKTLQSIFRLSSDPTDSNPAITRLKQDISLYHFIERYEPADGDTMYPWQVDFSLSVPRFHEPIEHISACFSGTNLRASDRVLFKSPIYLGSLLETCAYYQEQRDVMPMFLSDTVPPGARQEAEAQGMRFLQDPTLPEYHAIIHAISIGARQSEGVHGIALAAGLCTLLLNMPSPMLMESCRRVETAMKNRRCGRNGEVVAAEQMTRMTWICPEAALIHNACSELAKRSRSAPLDYSDELIFDLVPFWKKRQAEFFERSHQHYVETIQAMDGPQYFCDSIPALIENNRWLMEQQTLTFSINRLPKRPPIIFGDGFVLEGAAEFAGLVPHFEQADTANVEALLRIREVSHRLQ